MHILNNEIDPRKLKLVAEFYVELVNTLERMDTYYTIEGGELTGTSSLCSEISKNLGYGIVKEPTVEAKARIKETLGLEVLVKNPSEIIETIVDIFAVDRAETQRVVENKRVVSDRGILSTFIYQSGILDPETSYEQVRQNLLTVEEISIKRGVRAPTNTWVLVDTLNGNDSKRNFNIINKRLMKRIVNSEQELDTLDDVFTALDILDIYTKIATEIHTIDPSVIYLCDYNRDSSTLVEKFMDCKEHRGMYRI